MKLHTSPTSPFGRKCVMAAHVAGVADRLEIVHADYKSEAFKALNPLGKVPVLELDDGATLIDSPVIAAYLADQGDTAQVYPSDADAKWRALHLEALADGVTDAAILVYLEEARADGEKSPSFLDKQLGKMTAGLDVLERMAADFGTRTDIGVLAVAGGLSWIGLRHVGGDWRHGRPHLSAWMDELSRRDFFIATEPDA